MTVWNILFLFVLIALNAFFVSVEFAAVSSRRARLDVLTDVDSRAAKIVRTWLEQPAARDRLIAASQLGITLVSLALGAAGENTFQALLEPYFAGIQLPPALTFLAGVIAALPLVISLAVVTAFHVVLGEQVPKVAVLRGPEQFALKAAPIMQVFSSVFAWFVNLLDWATRSILRLLGLPPDSEHTMAYSLSELKEMVTGPEVEGVIDPPERAMLSAVIDFGELVVRQVANPRTEVVGVEADESVHAAVNLAVEHSLTKLPVYEDNLDQIIGVVHLRDLVRAQQAGRQEISVRELAREVLFVPETISVNTLLADFRVRRTHIAIVLDEFGGTAGLVTLEDLLEKIVGDVQDPFDATPPPIQSLPDGTALIDGQSLIAEVNEHFGLELADSNYDTIAGYLLGRLGRIPQPGDVVDVPEQHIRLKVDAMDRLRIARISLSHL